MASKQALDLAQAWLGSTGQDNTDLQFTDNLVIDPFENVTDHHTSNITKSTHLELNFVKIQGLVMNKQPHILADILHIQKDEALFINLINLWA